MEVKDGSNHIFHTNNTLDDQKRYALCPVSRVPCPVSRVPCPVSRVPCPVSRVPCPVSRVPCPVSLTELLSTHSEDPQKNFKIYKLKKGYKAAHRWWKGYVVFTGSLIARFIVINSEI